MNRGRAQLHPENTGVRPAWHQFRSSCFVDSQERWRGGGYRNRLGSVGARLVPLRSCLVTSWDRIRTRWD